MLKVFRVGRYEVFPFKGYRPDNRLRNIETCNDAACFLFPTGASEVHYLTKMKVIWKKRYIKAHSLGELVSLRLYSYI